MSNPAPVDDTKRDSALPSRPSSIVEAIKAPNEKLARSRHGSLSETTTHSVASTSIMEAKEKHTFHESDQKDTSVSAERGTAADVTTSKGRARPTLPILLAFIALCLSIFLVALDTVLIPTALPLGYLWSQAGDTCCKLHILDRQHCMRCQHQRYNASCWTRCSRLWWWGCCCFGTCMR
jgi:hypothetical protein